MESDGLAVATARVLTAHAPRLVDQLLEVFRAFDLDGTGYISAAELAPLPFEELRTMVRDADVDGRGCRD